MVDLGRMRLLPVAIATLMLIPASHAVEDDWSHYPSGAQPCLAQAGVSSRCEARTVEAQNACYCRNGGNFVTTTAECVGRTAPELLDAVYEMMKVSCSDSNTPLTISKAAFMEVARVGEPETTTSRTTRAGTTETSEPTDGPTGTTASGPATVTATRPSTPTPSSGTDDEEDEGGSGLSAGALAGIIVGAIGGFVVLAAIIYMIMQQRKKTGEESHPMLPQSNHPYGAPSAASMAASGQDTSYYGASLDPAAATAAAASSWHQKKEWASSPDARTSSYTWDSPYPGGGTPTPTQPGAAAVVVPIHEMDGSQHFLPGSAHAPAEMSGSPVVVPQQQPGVTQKQQQQQQQQQHQQQQPPQPPQPQYYPPYGVQQQLYPGSSWQPR
ncbi:hypothetical protein VTJ83DRAFT_4392 [Remersonia thermophila]|uniref:Extracellular membrane protein CFEM domain-containing protein n=1 Tax=Remersonia thermophila TaxID=72144 RepID=A0ABR4D9S2_9PEZI